MHTRDSIKDEELNLGTLERRLLNEFQHNFPLAPNPYEIIADRLGTDEKSVLEALEHLQNTGAVSRVGAVFQTHRVGASTLAAMAVPEEQLEEIAALVSAYTEVNHNYEREHHFNLWFVATAADEKQLISVLEDIEQRTGLAVMALPMLEDYHINLGFELAWT